MKSDIDPHSGRPTTGHEWDGIKELDTPVPTAFRIWLLASFGVCVPLWLLYPAWPYVSDYTRGFLGYSSRDAVEAAVADRAQARTEALGPILQGDLETLVHDTALKSAYQQKFSVLYRDNCAACHGRDRTGQPGFPNLADDHWLWSGSPEEVEWTVLHGINHTSDDTRYAEMPAFGRDEMLDRTEINAVTDYLLRLNAAPHDATEAAIGAELFAENCSACHNDGAVGGLETGAPSLVDEAWIYGGDRASLQQTLIHGRQGVMPGWQERLSPEEIRMIVLYVLWANNDDG